MTFELGRALLLSDAITPDALAEALHVVATRSVCLTRALLLSRAIGSARLEEELGRVDAPVLRHVVPVPTLMNHLPPGLCERLLALPVRRDPRTGTVDVAVVDARDTHAAGEIGYWLGAPVRVLRTTLTAMDTALRKLKAFSERGIRPLAAPIWVPAPMERPREFTETPLYGTPAVRIEDLAAAEPAAPLRGSPGDHGPDLAEPQSAPELVIPLTRKATPPGPPDPAVAMGSGDPVAPITRRGPFASRHRATEPDPVLQAFEAAASRDDVVAQLVAGARAAARKVGVLAVRRDAFVGWTCSPELGTEADFERIVIPAKQPTVFARAVTAGGYAGPLGSRDAHAALLQALPAGALDDGPIVVQCVRVDMRAALVVFGADVGDVPAATQRFEQLALAAGDALTRIIQRRIRT